MLQITRDQIVEHLRLRCAVAHGAATRAPSAILESVTLARVVAAALSLASTRADDLVGVVYSPAGATTLIISLGIITSRCTCRPSKRRPTNGVDAGSR